jgi:hypothetical protein
VVECLLKSGTVDAAAATITFSTPLHDACQEPNPDIARLLFQVRATTVWCVCVGTHERGRFRSA